MLLGLGFSLTSGWEWAQVDFNPIYARVLFLAAVPILFDHSPSAFFTSRCLQWTELSADVECAMTRMWVDRVCFGRGPVLVVARQGGDGGMMVNEWRKGTLHCKQRSLYWLWLEG
ncbi:hypothetical protein CBR_g40295 [Chara braunii]|uniref:Uncharacterized protein n=1 Tax=Chara braunii TaxID=69332 RepID=A0A388K1X5_CHABU|nr:hypothetical protein CBR_g40295 [Chara braunii]|eukprot:GBG64048.1 hypothetical protein CBR_g40295 [Chara braunii]